jgi:hypothetical protein
MLLRESARPDSYLSVQRGTLDEFKEVTDYEQRLPG